MHLFDGLIFDLMRLTRLMDIGADDMKAHYAPSELRSKQHESTAQYARHLLGQKFITTEEQLDNVLLQYSTEDLQAMWDLVEEELPNPFDNIEKPADFCSFCSKRPAWWEGANRDALFERGYKFVRPKDPEDGPGLWMFKGEQVVCDECRAQAESAEPPEPFMDGADILDGAYAGYSEEEIASLQRHDLISYSFRCTDGVWPSDY